MKRALFLILFMSVLTSGGVLAQGEAVDTRPEHSLFGIPTHPYGAFTISRTFDSDLFSPGIKFGVEADIDPIWIGLEIRLHDILTRDDAEIYPFDGEFEISLGGYW